MQRAGDLEIDQDLEFEERQWRVQRIGWAVVGVLVVAALLGLFGTGPLSATTAGSDEEGLTLQYQRFVRHQGEGELIATAGPNQAREGAVELWISTAYLGEIDVQGITPEPDEVRSAGDRLVYVFLVDDPGQPLEVSLGYTPKGMGLIDGEIGLVDGPSFSFTQVSYP